MAAEDGFEVAEGYMSVTPNTDGFKEQLEADLQEASAGVAAVVGTDLDSEGLREKVTAAVEEAGAGQDVKIKVDLDENAIRNMTDEEFNKFVADLQQKATEG